MYDTEEIFTLIFCSVFFWRGVSGGDGGGGKSMTQGRKQGKCFALISLLVELGPFPLNSKHYLTGGRRRHIVQPM